MKFYDDPFDYHGLADRIRMKHVEPDMQNYIIPNKLNSIFWDVKMKGQLRAYDIRVCTSIPSIGDGMVIWISPHGPNIPYPLQYSNGVTFHYKSHLAVPIVWIIADVCHATLTITIKRAPSRKY